MQGLLFLAIVSFGIAAFTQLVRGQPFPDCKTKCGNVTIEYPFGLAPGCYHDGNSAFKLTCNDKEKLMLYNQHEVINISPSGQLRILAPVSYDCYDSKGNSTNGGTISLDLPSLTLSPDNSFIGVGCNSFAFMKEYGLNNMSFAMGCISLCANGDSSGSLYEGSCHIPVPNGGNKVVFMPVPVDKDAPPHNICIYAFLVENGKFDNSALDDLRSLRNVSAFPVVFDWSANAIKVLMGIPTIKTVAKVPLLPCPDVNECTDLRPEYKHNCGDVKYCKNKEGTFGCNCPSGYRYHLKEGCIRKEFRWTPIFLGTIIGFLVLLLGVGCIYYQFQRRKVTELRKQYFEQNGGGMLKQRLSGPGSSNVNIKIFTEKCMETATNGYDESRILGQGGQGTVYKGILPDNSIVAIKKARLGDRSQVEQFINEVLVLSQINHRNVVKLLGCCLETEVPLLIYEFVANGTLYDHLHSSMCDSSLSWERRLTIAIEVAGSLSYLHSSASIPIIHRDIKTANILLDDHLTAKVADFGASRLIPMDREQLTTMVQGTLGYLDPEYYNSGQLNEKSDVYSFGVVLMELLSGQKALIFERPQSSKHLVSYFASAMKENRLSEIIDIQVMNADNYGEIEEVARIAINCTRLIGEERPKMREVAAELESLRVLTSKHQKSDKFPEPEELDNLPGVHFLSQQVSASGSGYDSIQNATIQDIETGR